MPLLTLCGLIVSGIPLGMNSARQVFYACTFLAACFGQRVLGRAFKC